MPFVPAANTVRVAVEYLSTYGDTAVNTFHFLRTSPPVTEANIGGLLTALKGWYTASWVNAASNQWQTDIFTARDMTTNEGIIVSDIETITGVMASPTLPSQDTIAVSLRTGLAGRSRRGRLFHVGLNEAQVQGSRIILAEASSLIEQYQALIDEMSEAGWTWVVASYVSAGAPRVTALLTPITNCILTDTVIDSQDRRKPTGA